MPKYLLTPDGTTRLTDPSGNPLTVPDVYGHSHSESLVGLTGWGASGAAMLAAHAESLPMGEALVKTVTQAFVGAVVFVERLKRAANMVIFDVLVRAYAGMTPSSWRKWADRPPPGYEEFRTLTPGKFKFETALVGARVRGGGADGRPGLSALTLNVDLPDVLDKGHLAVLSGGSPVTFARKFHVTPEITGTITSGTTAVSYKLTAASTTGFTVTLYDVAGAATTGTFSWHAVGY